LARDRFSETPAMYDDTRSRDPSTRRVWLCESYFRVDYDGDGIAELRKVCSIGNVILANEEADLIPFAAITPIVFPHRHIGIGYDDLCEQPSAVKTALIRLFLDNGYQRHALSKWRYGVRDATG